MIVLTKTDKEKIEKAMRAYKREESSKSATLEKITVMARKCIKYNYSLVKGYDTNVLTKIAIEALKDAMDYYDGDLEKFVSLVDYFIIQKLESHINRFPSQLIPKYSTVMTNILRKYPELPSEKISYAREVISIIGESYLDKKTRSIIKSYYEGTIQTKEAITRISNELQIPRTKVKSVIDKFDTEINMRIIPMIGTPVKEEKPKLGLIAYAISLKYSSGFVNESLCYLPEKTRKKFVTRFGEDLNTPKPNLTDKELEKCYEEFTEFLQNQINPIMKPSKPNTESNKGIFAYTRKEGYTDEQTLEFIQKCSPEMQTKLSMLFGKNYDRINGYSAVERQNAANELLLYMLIGFPDTPQKKQTTKTSRVKK